ncbi:zinc-dependent alcohol dehydrogenase family protein [Natrinema gelatinilyticum]|uniref:zinc-dependent alcohol dehydrogenase family protein n=1 Tax=Natrinema gelatinilyticum TaxID=2961571 RepID=UPI0020C2D436|nr:zinc-dependent alcohol dehydrogenase family protein [Natrinema gelatinilyticum]
MRAAVLEEHGEPLVVTDVDYPEPAPDQVVVETKACGICRSDWHAWQGDWEWMGISPESGQIFGHEPAGVVSEVGADVETLSEGDRVTVPFHLGDGTCPYCQNGQSNVCDTGIPLGFIDAAPGAYAEAFPVREADFNATKLPDGVEYEEMAALGCRFMTAYHGIADRANIRPGDVVAVHGCGGVGLSAIHIANALGAIPIAVDVQEEKLDRAENLGAAATINGAEIDDVPGEVQAANDGQGVDVAVDALGIQETCHNSVMSLCKTGTHVQIGLTEGDTAGELSLPVDMMTLQELNFHGSYGMPLNRYEELFRLIERGTLEPQKIIGQTLSLEDAPETLASMDDYETVGIPVITEF